jgi:WD40 repeat protein
MRSQGKSPQHTGELDLAPHRAWRRFVPVWLRSLIWVDSASRYDAFLSYSWKSDKQVAPVIQSVLQGFLRPWNKVRAKAIFRDLSCLPAGSSLQKELFDRIDRSQHFIVLASPEAAISAGMNMEARYWFSRPRDGEVLVIVTKGSTESWDMIRNDLLPPVIAKGLSGEPLWIPLQRRDDILSNPSSSKLRGELVEDLKQVLLRLHAPATWEELHGIERARRRRALWAVSAVAMVLLTLAIGAGILAWMEQRQRNLANRNAKMAEARAEIALSRQLALQVLNRLPNPARPYEEYDLPRSLLLAVQALRTSDTLEARSALLRAIQYQPYKSLYLWPEAGHEFLHGILISDQRQLIAVQDDGIMLRRDLTTGETTRDASSVQNGKIRSAALSSDGQILAFHRGDTITLYDVSRHSSTETNIKVPDQDDGAKLVFSPDNKILAVIRPDQSAVLWRVGERQVWKQLLPQPKSSGLNSGAPLDAALSEGGAHLAWIQQGMFDNLVYWSLGDNPAQIAVNSGRDTTVGSVALRGDVLALGVGGLSGSSGEPQDQNVILQDIRTHKSGTSGTVESGGPADCVGFSPDGSMLAAGYSEGFMTLLSTEEMEAGAGRQQSNADAEGGSSKDKPELLYALPALYCWISMGAAVDHAKAAVALVTPDGAYVVDTAAKNNFELDDKAVQDPVTGEFADLVRSIQSCVYDQRCVSDRSLDGKVGAYQQGSDIVVKNEKTGATVGRPIPTGNARAVAATVGGRLATADQDGKLTVWNVLSGKSTVLAEKDTDCSTLTFNSDGTRLAVGTNSGTITLWDAVSGRVISSLSSPERSGTLTTVVFSPDGKTLASTGFKSGDLVLWDVASRRALDVPVNFGMETTELKAFGFSSDGKRLLVEGDDGLGVIDVDPKSWMRRACSIANRNLTCKEWHMYIGTEPYEKTCPDSPSPPDCK